ncbi:hypothetical protein [Candidatus Enterovibrio escicola]|uniref:hypothetical protein n=1 Tax=Candidatus Enterovibrio escicola TaxID=1927127 RepID=UPI0030DCB8D7
MTPKLAVNVTEETIDLLMPYKKQVHTITANSGQKLAHHEKIVKDLGVKIYSFLPY